MTPARHARLTALFGEALELGLDERARLLDRVRTDDPALAVELGDLLVADGEAASALATGGLGYHQRAASNDATVQLSGGETKIDAARIIRTPFAPSIPGYRLVGVLGKGGMGTVYAAEQEAPRRPVAIKVLHTTTDAALARFQAEAEIMARLDHPGIARIYEAGEASGHPYFVMERVEGVTLDEIGKLPRTQRLALFAAICDAVHHAHVKGIFHRDLKPSNVMVRPDGRVAVLDFGIARAAAGGASDGETRAGELMGTPLYMSPEQARLRPDEVDARSDVYTLGLMLYELVSGELPYDIRGKSLSVITRAICDTSPRPLSHRDPTLRGDLEAICEHALAKEPERRYPSAAALAADVRCLLEGARVSVRVPGSLEQVRRFIRRRPGYAAMFGAGIAAASVVTVLWLDARAARRIADAERARVTIAHAALEDRTNQLVLDHARATLVTDPTQTVTLLRTLTPRGVDPDEAWEIADEALGRGVAAEVRHAHDDEIRWVEPAPGGYVTGGYDGRVVRWTASPAPQELARLTGRVHIVRPSPDGHWFAIGGDAGLVRVVDETGRVVAEPGPCPGDAEKIVWSPDGTRLAIGDDRGCVLVWSREAVARPLTVGDRGDRDEIESLAWSTEGSAVVAGTDSGMVWRWDLATGTAASARTSSEVLAIWSAGDRVTAAGADGRVTRWRVAGDRLVLVDEIASGLACKSAAFAPDGTYAVLGGVDGRVARVVGTAIESFAPHPRQIRSVAVAVDGRRFATSSDDGLIQVWDLPRARRLVLRGHTQRVRQLTFGAGGSELLSGDSEGTVRRWELDRIPPSVLAPHAAIARVAASTDGRTLVSADTEGELLLWDLASGGSTRIGVHPRLTALAVGTSVISAGADGTIAWWMTVPTRHTLPGPVRALALSPDGRWVAAATAAGPIGLYSGDGTPVAMLAGHAGGTEAVALSADGSLVVSGGQDRTIRVWRTAMPSAPPLELGPIADDMRHILFARGGALLVAAGDDGKVTAWRVAGGTIDPASRHVLASHHGAVIALASDGGDRIVSVGRDRGRTELDLARNTQRSVAADAASQLPDGRALRAIPLPLPGGRELVIAADGAAILVRDSSHHDFAALRVRLEHVTAP